MSLVAFNIMDEYKQLKTSGGYTVINNKVDNDVKNNDTVY